MNTTDLVPVFTGELNGQPVQLVNARDLYHFLEIARDFSTWIKKRLKDGGFIEGLDYISTLTRTGERSNVTQIDYHLTLETAKHIGMMERNDKGHEVRRYFIDCERKAHAPVPRLDDRVFTDPDYICEVVRTASEFIQTCKDSARTGAPIPSLDIFSDKIIEGLCAYALHNRRYLVRFDKPLEITPLSPTTVVLDPHDPKDMAKAMGQLVPVSLIPEIVNQCVQRLAGKFI